MAHFSRRRKIGIAVIALAFAPFGIAYRHANRYNWTPLDHHIELRKGEVRSVEFVPDVAGSYVLFLQVIPRKIETQRLYCLLDAELFHPEQCEGIPQVVELSWNLWNDGRTVANNTSEQTWRALRIGNGYTRREIGRFHADHGRRYVISINFHRDPSELNVAEPRLVAEAIQDYEGFAIEVQGSFGLGVLATIVGAVLVAPLRRPALNEPPRV